jgi:NAD(P)-dependent dehydrogenase (short-subunit alcohol dehydrogenase family)
MMHTTLITGGARGIGAATARLLARQGHRLGIGYLRHETEAQALVDAIRAEGGDAIALQADIADEAQVLALFERLDRELGPLTGLVNNAAILLPQGRIETLDAARINRILATNVTGSILCAREAVKRMALRHGGRGGAIVNVSSAAARLGSPGEYLDYAASKGAIDTLTRGLALEVADDGIRVNAVRPGFIATDMHADGGDPDRIERIRASIPMKRGGRPEEVAEAIAWLLSDAASYMTGGFLDVAGGR